MLTKEIKKYTKNISFAYLYFSEPKLTKLKNYSSLFSDYKEYDLDNSSFTKRDFDFIVVEIAKLNKKNFEKLNEIVKQNSFKSIIVFAEDYNNAVLTKFLIYSSLNHAYPLQNSEDELQKILLNSLKQSIDRQSMRQQININKKINTFFSFLIFKDSELIFANDNAKKLFNSSRLSQIEEKISKREDIKRIVASETDDKAEISISNSDKEGDNFILYSNSFPKADEKLITIIQDENRQEDSINLTIDRFQFIETIKDKLAQNSVENDPIILIFININNYDKLKKNSTNISIHNMMKRVLEEIFYKKTPDEKLVYWDKHFFVLHTKESDFGIAKQKLKAIHEKLIYLDYEEGILPNITSSVLDIGSLKLNEAISCIENINHNSYDKNNFKTDNFYELNNLNAFLDEKEQIKYLLNNHQNNKIPIKLLNIYKGLCINTESKILKSQNDNYFVSCENLQAYSMRFENRTVIQAPGFPKDIQAYISYIDMEKSYAILDRLSFLNSSANNRQYTRVQPKIRMPILIRHKKSSLHGEVLDISTKAIAITVNRPIRDEYLYKNIDLSFRLPNSSNEDGYDLMETKAKAVNIIETKESKSKLIAMLELEKPYDSYLLEYMYNRQKELIIELKRASKL